MKGKNGRARFGSAEEFQAAADAYFAICDAAGKPYRIKDLAFALGVTEKTLHRWRSGYECRFLQEVAKAVCTRVLEQFERPYEGYKYRTKFGSAEEFQAAADAYFTACDAAGRPYRKSDLAVALGISPAMLYNWSRGYNCRFLQKAARLAYLRIEQDYINRLQNRMKAELETTVRIRHSKDVDMEDFK